MALAASDAVYKCHQVEGGGGVLERLRYFAYSALHSGTTMSSDHAERSSNSSNSIDRYRHADDVQRHTEK